MGAILYPPKGVDYNEWLCELMCGWVEEDADDWADEDNGTATPSD